MNAIISSLQAVARDARIELLDKVPRITPHTVETVAAVCRLASAEGWTVRVTGRGSWQPSGGPADLVLATTALNRIARISPGDLTATVETGVPFSSLQERLGDAGVWFPFDPPGWNRTLGSVLATGTTGSLLHGKGPVRHGVLGCTVVTGDGRVVTSGAPVVKNVAGYDLTKLHIGGFGGFGVLVEAHLRLAAIPGGDRTAALHGSRPQLLATARSIIAEGLDLAALELCSPGILQSDRWTLALRLMGGDRTVEAEAGILRACTSPHVDFLTPPEDQKLWEVVARTPLDHPATLRMVGKVTAIDEVIGLIEESLPLGAMTIGPGTGQIRWSGSPSVEALRRLRHSLAGFDIPLTLERAPTTLRDAVGVYGAYRPGVGDLVSGLRATFDPAAILAPVPQERSD